MSCSLRAFCSMNTLRGHEKAGVMTVSQEPGVLRRTFPVCKLVKGLLSKFYAFSYIRVIVCTQLERFLHHFAAMTYRVGIYQYSRLASRSIFVSQLAHRPLEASSN